MKMYHESGGSCEAHKDQLDIMLDAGWSKEPFPQKEDVKEDKKSEPVEDKVDIKKPAVKKILKSK